MSRADFEACPWQLAKNGKHGTLVFRPGFVQISAPHIKRVEFNKIIPRAVFSCFARRETRFAWMSRYNPTYELKRDLFLAVALGLDEQLGRHSPLRSLDDDILRLIFRNLTLA
jgi:hypothetical protein